VREAYRWLVQLRRRRQAWRKVRLMPRPPADPALLERWKRWADEAEQPWVPKERG